MHSPSVLVVGAGPAGLVLALSLAQNGVKARLIEKDPHLQIGQRGALIQPRTLEMHHFLGSLSDVLAIASPVPLMKAYAEGNPNPIKTFDILYKSAEPSDAFPTRRSVLLGQETHIKILTSHFEKYGGRVELGTELRSLEQFSDRVIVNMVHSKDGVEVLETAEFDYVVGADGAHSKVRKALGLTFLGETRRTERMVIGDVYIEDLDTDYWHFWGDASSSMVSLRPARREAPGLFNFIIAGAKVDLDRIIGRDEVMEFLRGITGIPHLSFGRMVWISPYTPNIRTINAFRAGRGFIVGDAAHIHSPTGAQGMNSSVQDSFNLGWKLALVIKGLANPQLLDSYNAERLPVITGMLQRTSELHGKLFKAGNDIQDTWDRGGSLDQLGVNYRSSSIVVDYRGEQTSVNDPYGHGQTEVLRAGDRAPDASRLVTLETSEAMRLFDIFGATYHTVLIFISKFADTVSIVDAVKKYPAGLVRSVLILPPQLPNAFVTNSTSVDLAIKDEMNHAHRAYSVQDGTTAIVAVRPDGVVGAVVTSIDGLRLYFDKIFIETLPTVSEGPVFTMLQKSRM